MIWFLLFMVANSQAQVADPHGGRYTSGLGRQCSYCHDSNRPRAADEYRMAALMAKMVAGLNAGPLRPKSIDCVTCHRAGGPEHNLAHPLPLNRSEVERMMAQWPGPATAPEGVRRSMSTYAVSLGVACNYCHVAGDWKADSRPAMKATRAMAALMNAFPKYLDYSQAAAITCFTCHQGALKTPSRVK